MTEDEIKNRLNDLEERLAELETKAAGQGGKRPAIPREVRSEDIELLRKWLRYSMTEAWLALQWRSIDFYADAIERSKKLHEKENGQ